MYKTSNLINKQHDRLRQLAEKWRTGTITDEELAEFSDWLNTIEENPVTIDGMTATSEEQLRNRIFENISSHRTGSKKYQITKRVLNWTMAACLVAIFAGGVYVFSQKDTSSFPGHKVQDKLAPTVEKPVVPGGNKALLILADGKEITLDSANTGKIAEDEDARIFKLRDGQLACATAVSGQKTSGYNVLSTPRGGQYSITLADGTKVWLNSASSLKWPSAFHGSERVVELTGEGYFEVASKQAMPFKVLVNKSEVTVIGTHFNIMAYADEPQMRTTLLEGSVSVKREKKPVFLLPGQQAQVALNGNIRLVRDVDTEQVIAWKNGVFNFTGSDIETTMRQIARWYDVEVKYERHIPEHFNGSIPRNASIEKILTMLSHTGVGSFQLRSRQIIVR